MRLIPSCCPDKHEREPESSLSLLYLVTTERLRMISRAATIVVLSTTASAIALLVFASGDTLRRLWRTPTRLSSFFGLGFICQLAGYFLSDPRVGPCTRNLVLLAVAPLTAVLAFFLFDEVMTVLQLLGGGLILTAVWIITNQSQASCLEA